MLAGLALVFALGGPSAPAEFSALAEPSSPIEPSSPESPTSSTETPTPTVVLSWTAPERCPDEATVLAEIEQLVGRPLGQDPEQRLEVEGRIELEVDRYRLALRIRGEGEIERTFTAERCDDLLVPAAVSVAIAVDPSTSPSEERPKSNVPLPPREQMESTEREPVVDSVVSEPEPNRDGSTGSSLSASTTDTRVPRRRGPRPRSRPHLALSGGAGLAGGLLPRAGGTVVLGAGLVWPRVRVDLEGVALTRRRATLPSDSGDDGGGDLRVGAARPLICRRLGGPTWHAPICGGVELGVLSGRGYGVEMPQTRRHLWLAGLAAAGASWSALARLTVRLRAELIVSPLRREFTLVAQSLFVTRSVGGRLRLGLEIHFR